MKRFVLFVLFVLSAAPLFAQEIDAKPACEPLPTCSALPNYLTTGAEVAVRPPAAPAFVEPITLHVEKRNRALPWNWFRASTSATLMQANVQNPTTIEFTASPDHAVTENGVALVTKYDVQIFNSANAVATTITTLGKPTPVSGLITNNTLLRPATIGLPAGTYTAKVLAVGPGGSTPSLASNPFDLTPRSPTASGTPVIR